MESLPTVNGYPKAADLFLNEDGMTWSAAIHHGKQCLVRSLETGAGLQDLRNQLGDQFWAWVDTQTSMSRTDAEFFIQFYEQSALPKESLTPDVEMKLPHLLALLRRLNDPEHAMPACSTPKPKRAADKASTLKKKSTGSAGGDASPVAQISDSPQLELTVEQRQLLLSRSPKLLLLVNMGDLSIEDAICRARDLPDRDLTKSKPR